MSIETKEMVRKALDLQWEKTNLIPSQENIVHTCKLNKSLNLNLLYRKLIKMGPQYNQRRFPALVFRRRIPQGAVLVFKGGKFVCTGAKSTEHAREHINSMIECFTEAGYKDLRLESKDIHNMVGAVSLGGKFDLDKVRDKLNTTCNYTPDNFPGAVLRFTEILPIAVLVFKSSSIVITGAKSYEQIKSSFNTIFPILEKLYIPNGMTTCLADYDEGDIITGELGQDELQGDEIEKENINDKDIPSYNKMNVNSIFEELLTLNDFNTNTTKGSSPSKKSNHKRGREESLLNVEESFINKLRSEITKESTFTIKKRKTTEIDTTVYSDMPILPFPIIETKSKDQIPIVIKKEAEGEEEDEEISFGSDSD